MTRGGPFKGGQKKKPLWGTCIGIYAGQYFDSETGLHYNYHRYYDPKIGRYLRADPIGIEGGVNFYQYANANPINWYDSDGLKTVCNVTGKWTTFPHPTNIGVVWLGTKNDWGNPGLFPPRVRIGYVTFEASADIKFAVKCKKSCLCTEEDREWSLSDQIPIHHVPINIPVKIKASHWALDAAKLAWATKEAYKKAKNYFLFEAAKIAADPNKWRELDDLGILNHFK